MRSFEESHIVISLYLSGFRACCLKQGVHILSKQNRKEETKTGTPLG
jgi:hypothetical protein